MHYLLGVASYQENLPLMFNNRSDEWKESVCFYFKNTGDCQPFKSSRPDIKTNVFFLKVEFTTYNVNKLNYEVEKIRPHYLFKDPQILPQKKNVILYRIKLWPSSKSTERTFS